MMLLCLIINVVFGLLVLGSYAFGIATHSAAQNAALWGSIPSALRVLYFISMLFAAAGYFLFSHLVIFRLNPGWQFVVIYCLILIPSALWMPLSFSMIENPSAATWLSIRVVLAIVGLASLWLVVALLTLQPRPEGWAYWSGLAGAIVFCAHTLILDALVWPIFFRAS